MPTVCDPQPADNPGSPVVATLLLSMEPVAQTSGEAFVKGQQESPLVAR